MNHQAPNQEYTEYHHHLQHPTMGTLPMFSAGGLNLTVMSQSQHPSHQLIYANPIDVQQQQHLQLHQQQQAHHQQQHPQHIAAVVAHQQQHPHIQPQHQQLNQQGQHSNQHQQHQQQQHQQQQHQPQTKKQKKQQKVNKDGVPAPKRATTAYINFTQWYREELKKTGRTIPKIGEFGKECAAKWNSMSEDDKAPFLETASKDRDRYKREMAIYKPARDVNKPKRPTTAFMLFMSDFRREMAGREPDGGVSALAKAGGERWRGMTDEEKRPYVERQNEEKVRYDQNMEEYRRKNVSND